MFVPASLSRAKSRGSQHKRSIAFSEYAQFLYERVGGMICIQIGNAEDSFSAQRIERLAFLPETPNNQIKIRSILLILSKLLLLNSLAA